MLNKKKYSIYNSTFLPSLATKPHKGNNDYDIFLMEGAIFVITVWLQCTLRSVRCKLALENIFFYHIHTEKYSLKSCVVNFDTQISSSHSEE